MQKISMLTIAAIFFIFIYCAVEQAGSIAAAAVLMILHDGETDGSEDDGEIREEIKEKKEKGKEKDKIEKESHTK